MESVVRPQRPGRRRLRWSPVVLALVVSIAGFLTPQRAEAAPTIPLSGQGPGSSSIVALSAGVYLVEISYSSNTDDWGGTNFIAHLETVSGQEGEYLTNDIAASGSLRQVVRFAAAQSVWLDVTNAAQSAIWNASLTRLGAADASGVPFSASYAGRDVAGPLQLPVGLYRATVSYSDNADSYGATNFIMHFDGEGTWGESVFNDIATSGSVSKNLRVTQAGLYWFNVSDAAQGAQWSIMVTSLDSAKAKFSATPTPKISGKAKVGKKLKAKTGTWKPSGVSLAYQWYRNSSKIGGATGAGYKLTKKDRGKKIKVAVTGSKAGYASVTKTSKATAKVKK